MIFILKTSCNCAKINDKSDNNSTRVLNTMHRFSRTLCEFFTECLLTEVILFSSPNFWRLFWGNLKDSQWWYTGVISSCLILNTPLFDKIIWMDFYTYNTKCFSSHYSTTDTFLSLNYLLSGACKIHMSFSKLFIHISYYCYVSWQMIWTTYVDWL